MKLIIGGSIAIILAILGFGYAFSLFFKFLAGIVPILLLIAGGIALYLYREMKCDEGNEDTGCSDSGSTAPPADTPLQDLESDNLKAEPETAPAPSEPDPVADEADSGDVSAPEEESPAAEQAETEKEIEAPADVADEKEKQEPAVAEKKFIGNVGSMVFHIPDCKFATGKNCTAFFGSKDEALEAGYRACGTCKP